MKRNFASQNKRLSGFGRPEATERPERQKPAEEVWAEFKSNCGLTEEQLYKFLQYERILSKWNLTRNLTALTNLSAIVNQHFCDSIFCLSDQCNLPDSQALKTLINRNVKRIADVGSGAGFPGLPLKIIYPHLKLLLIEVCKKKQEFLAAAIDELQLEEVEIVDIDWRTFLRKTSEPVDLFVTKAALDDVELARMFRMTSAYRDKQILCWVSFDWAPHPKATQFVRQIIPYSIKRKERKLVLLGA